MSGWRPPELKGHPPMSVPHRRETARGDQASPEQPTVEKWGNAATRLPLEPQKSWEGKQPLVCAYVSEDYTRGRRFTFAYWLETPSTSFPSRPHLVRRQRPRCPGTWLISVQSLILPCYFSFLHHFLQFVNTKTAFLPSPLWRVKAQDVVLKPTTETLQLGWSCSEALTGAVTAVPRPQAPSCL